MNKGKSMVDPDDTAPPKEEKKWLFICPCCKFTLTDKIAAIKHLNKMLAQVQSALTEVSG